MYFRRSIEGLGPYASLFLLGVPMATVEPLKLAAVAIAGKGHWITGTAMIVACYAFSLLFVERLFVIVKPKILTIPWFARLWRVFALMRARAMRLLRGWTRLPPDRKLRPPISPPPRAGLIDKRLFDRRSAVK